MLVVAKMVLLMMIQVRQSPRSLTEDSDNLSQQFQGEIVIQKLTIKWKDIYIYIYHSLCRYIYTTKILDLTHTIKIAIKPFLSVILVTVN